MLENAGKMQARITPEYGHFLLSDTRYIPGGIYFVQNDLQKI